MTQKTQNKFRYWFDRLNCKRFFLLVGLVFLLTAVFELSIAQAGSLSLPGQTGDNIGVIKLNADENDKYLLDGDSKPIETNDDLIKSLTGENGLIGKIIRITKYILAALFALFFVVYVFNLMNGADNEENINEFKKATMYSLLGFIILAVADPLANAFFVATEGGNLVTDPEYLKRSAQLTGFSFRSVARALQYLMGGVALIYMSMSAYNILTAEDEEKIKNAKKTLTYAVLGLIIATSIFRFVDNTFFPSGDSGATPLIFSAEIENAAPDIQLAASLAQSRIEARTGIITTVKYFETFVGATAVLMLFLAGFKMVTASGNEEVITKQRKMISWIFMGLAMILFAEIFVNIFMPSEDVIAIFGDKEIQSYVIGMPSTSQITSFAAQMGGATNFILTFAGGLAVLALIVGALYLATAAVNPEQAEKGKKIILGATLGIIITISAYAVVNTILSGKAEQPNISVNLGNFFKN